VKDFNKALNYSFFLLKFRARSKNEIASRLKQKSYSSCVIKQVLSYLEESNYINDEDFTQCFVNYSLEKGWGPRRIDFNLKKLGISYELRKQALAADIDYRAKIRDIIKKKTAYYRKEKVEGRKIWQKISRSLAAKGFNYDDIFREMNDMGVSRLEDK
jgi:regulatory protein